MTGPASPTSPITTHVLDTALGKPVKGVPITLEAQQQPGGAWKEVGRGETDANGRLQTLLAPAAFSAGRYRLTFHTEPHFAAVGVATFYPSVTVVFEVRNTAEHYHVPLLLSPYGYSTYRGS
jgi:5-hydroxyisourate hydrolase